MIRRFLRLSWSDQRLIVRMVLLLTAIRAGLWLLPFDVLRRRLRTGFPLGTFPSAPIVVPVERLARLVAASSRVVPGATCLTQSLAVQFLLTRAGYASVIRLGVARNDACGFEAHAWVDCHGQVLLDHPADIARYTVLASFPAA
jgi:transglutaminase superfamily protein